MIRRRIAGLSLAAVSLLSLAAVAQSTSSEFESVMADLDTAESAIISAREKLSAWCQPGHPHYDPAICSITTTTEAPTTSTTTTTEAPTTTLPPVVTTTTTTPVSGIYGAGVQGAALPIPSGAVAVTTLTLASAIQNNPAGTIFALAPGVYRVGNLPNKVGNGYYGVPTDHRAVILDGETTYSGTSPTSGKMRPWTELMDNNTIANMTVRRYRGDDTKGSAPLWGGGADGVIIRNVEVYENQFSGIRFAGTVWDVSYVTSRHNGQYCYNGSGTGHTLSHFIAFECGNSGLPVPRNADSDRGGSKFVQTNNFTVEDGEVADMDDNGLWFDIANRNVVIRRLWVHGVEQHGIVVEASFGPALIEDNLVENSAFENQTSAYRRACIFFAVTENVTIRNNTVDGCKNGIMGYQWNHPQYQGTVSGKVQATPVRNARVHNNVIRNITHHWAGIASLTALAGCDANDPCADNQFFDNVYVGTSQFWWDDATRNLSYWTAQGHS